MVDVTAASPVGAPLPAPAYRVDMLRRRRIAQVLSVLVLTAGCACGCGPVGPSPDLTSGDLVGAWANDRGGTITLNADGTFSADRLRACIEEPSAHDTAGPGAGRGSWVLHEPETMNPYQDVELVFDTHSGDRPRWKADGKTLRYVIGDPDAGDACVFRR